MSQFPERLPLGRRLHSPDFWENVRPQAPEPTYDDLVEPEPEVKPPFSQWFSRDALRALGADLGEGFLIVCALAVRGIGAAWRRATWRITYAFSRAWRRRPQWLR